jgi:uncharacterized protein YukE
MFTRKTDHVKIGARNLRQLGETLAHQVEVLTSEAGDRAVEFQAEWRKSERGMRDARKRLAKPVAELTDLARDFAHDVRARITSVLR